MSVASEVAQRLQAGLNAYSQAARLIMRYYGSAELTVDTKLDATPVTVADREAERLLRDELGRLFPKDGFLGEEFGEQAGTSGYHWILDPVDGTKSFVAEVPLFGTLIGLELDGEPVAGIAGLPAMDEVIYASSGQGTWRRRGQAAPVRCRVSQTKHLREAIYCFTSAGGFEVTGRWAAYETLCRTCRLTRGWGDCYGHLLVATGRADIMVDPAMAVWDAAPLVPIMQEAGGHFIDWKGQATSRGGDGISVNAELLAEALGVLQTCELRAATRSGLD